MTSLQELDDYYEVKDPPTIHEEYVFARRDLLNAYKSYKDSCDEDVTYGAKIGDLKMASDGKMRTVRQCRSLDRRLTMLVDIKEKSSLFVLKKRAMLLQKETQQSIMDEEEETINEILNDETFTPVCNCGGMCEHTKSPSKWDLWDLWDLWDRLTNFVDCSKKDKMM